MIGTTGGHNTGEEKAFGSTADRVEKCPLPYLDCFTAR